MNTWLPRELFEFGLVDMWIPQLLWTHEHVATAPQAVILSPCAIVSSMIQERWTTSSCGRPPVWGGHLVLFEISTEGFRPTDRSVV